MRAGVRAALFQPDAGCYHHASMAKTRERRRPESVQSLCRTATRLRDQAKGRTISFSPKVFIPLTRLCRDRCGYCAFRQDPSDEFPSYMTPDQVLTVVRRGEELGCREALFVLGDRPERCYPRARRWLRQHGYDSTIEYLYDMCSLVLEETRLFPHSNPGILTRRELAALKQVNASMGLMLESASRRLSEPGGPHYQNPTKDPQLRLRVLQDAGELKIPFTTGLLIGIGETFQERIDSLHRLRRLQSRYGHLQEFIIQNFVPKPGTPMESVPGATGREMMETISHARLILGGSANLQAPPNLSAHNRRYLDYLDAGINDWGGISPLTIDFVNPEAPWPRIADLARQAESRGFRLRARYPVYPEYIRGPSPYLTPSLRSRLQSEADPDGYFPVDSLRTPVPVSAGEHTGAN